MNFHEATANWRTDKPHFEMRGLTVPSVVRYLPDEWKRDVSLAYDALPTLTTDPNSGIPALLTTSIDPEVTRILFTPNKAAEIFGEKRAGTWLDQTRLFPVVEHTYGDFATSGRTGVNADWPNRQAYLFQVLKTVSEILANPSDIRDLDLPAPIKALSHRLHRLSLILLGFFSRHQRCARLSGT
jgi:hypothetical protein